MFTRHPSVLRDLHITASMNGLTADVTTAYKRFPFAHGKQLPLREPGVCNQCPDNTARVAFANIPTDVGFRGWGHVSRDSTLSTRGYLAHTCPSTYVGGKDFCSPRAFPGSLF